MFDVVALAILQGIAEFLPISSSGHLVLGKSLLGLGETGLRLDIFLHLGTLVAVFIFYAAVVGRIIAGAFAGGQSSRDSWTYVAKIVLSAVPAGLVGVFFKDALEAAFASPKAVGCALVFTGAVLFATRFLPRGKGEVTFARALWMGLAQAVAILPGVSRSGMTLAAARATGVDAERSAEFSFLMSAPPIAGAALLEVLDLFKDAQGASAVAEVGWGACVFGAVVAAIVGYFALKLLLRTLKGDRFWLFGPYCALAGLVTLVLA